ncbi:NAD(P)H-flavin reductase [Photobacterium aquimaris]|uniref:NAD(P)H-flavin reductase n=1 Tax=Photobacterium aquimaris TaxID=512643 RepID=I3VLY4_9GAMM|nr:NAD(P)H-flavin reductase [Photobacterium aquimaris]AFK80978.1 putative flavin reductase [Photobacterium aquimaris]OBU13920.1 NAD(P)H-flavin reductase [Photobacterium aquimaris]OBU15698.1 NAD(P)H-flavin reductase [Photobacterium aquimaris]PSU28748.1 NAD(P)H-flavin reductase [Photobacterium aquimaris]PSW01558.1 NAD(P)H-flavin reductase [Photobacterium aquimaris]
MILNCKIIKIEASECNIFKVFIKPDKCLNFKAGQYVLAYLDGKKLPFSIANCPTCNELIELHVGSSVKETAVKSISHFVDAFVNSSEIQIDAPHGNAWLREDSNSPLLLIAGGTGLSYINSILSNCVNRKLSRSIYVYWGVNNINLLYADSQLKALSSDFNNVSYVPVLENFDNSWYGKKGNVIDAVIEDFCDLSDFDIYICGPQGMTRSVREKLTLLKKADTDKMFSDAFAYL